MYGRLKMMNIKFMSESDSLVKCIQVSKMVITKLMSDSLSLVKCIHVS